MHYLLSIVPSFPLLSYAKSGCNENPKHILLNALHALRNRQKTEFRITARSRTPLSSAHFGPENVNFISAIVVIIVIYATSTIQTPLL
jgi:hypothetical protein